MHKGFFSQTFVVLFQGECGLDEIKPLLTEFNVVKEVSEEDKWEFSGPSLLVAYLPEVNGYATIDLVNRPWPDGMGDPKKADEVMLLGAWSMGYFGPFAYPRGLARALQQSWRWDKAKEIVPQHTAFARIRLSYVLGADTPCLPENYAPLPELDFTTSLTLTLLQHSKALCYFNPNGEVVLTKALLDETTCFARDHDLLALTAWCNIRVLTVNPTWLLMDTVGNLQLDIPDHEMCFPKGQFDLGEIDRWLRNVTDYVFKKGRIIKDGDTMDGPGQIRWQAKTFPNGLCDPPREVMRWLPCGVKDIPPQLLQGPTPPETKPDKAKARKWLFW